MIRYLENDKLCQKELGAEEIRKGRIALAHLKFQLLKDGINLQPQELRSMVGRRVDQLNVVDPTLNLTFEEGMDFVKELVSFLGSKAFQPKPRRSKHDALAAKHRQLLREGQAEINDPELDTDAGHQRYMLKNTENLSKADVLDGIALGMIDPDKAK